MELSAGITDTLRAIRPSQIVCINDELRDWVGYSVWDGLVSLVSPSSRADPACEEWSRKVPCHVATAEICRQWGLGRRKDRSSYFSCSPQRYGAQDMANYCESQLECEYYDIDDTRPACQSLFRAELYLVVASYGASKEDRPQSSVRTALQAICRWERCR